MMNLAMFEIFLRSAGAPKSVIDLMKMFQREGFTGFGLRPIPDDAPIRHMVQLNPERKSMGFWLGAEGPNSRVTGVIYVEGVNDELLEKMSGAAGVPALPSQAS
jgi:hypothetical protein